MAEGEEKDSGGFLPPQPSGPQGPQSPAPNPGGGWQQQSPPPPPGHQAPPAPPGQPQPGPYQQPYGQQPVYAPPPRDPNDPGNSSAIVALVLSVVSIGLLFISAGLSSVLSLGLGIAGIVLGVRARRSVREGVTRQHKDMATAGFAVGIGATLLSAVATLFWGLVLIGYAASSDFRDGFDEDFESNTLLPPSAVVRVTAVAGHTLATLLG